MFGAPSCDDLLSDKHVCACIKPLLIGTSSTLKRGIDTAPDMTADLDHGSWTKKVMRNDADDAVMSPAQGQNLMSRRDSNTLDIPHFQVYLDCARI